MKRLVLFDIDATLLLSGGAGMRAMKRASLELFGDRFSWDVVDSSGGLDPQLFREAARHSALTVSEADHEVFRSRYEEHLEEELTLRKHEVRAMPGVLSILSTLRGRYDVVLGLLTGNYPRAAAMKLAAIGVEIGWFRVRVFGDDGLTRPDLGRVALRRIAETPDGPIEPFHVVVVGDTPKDVDCARANRFKVLAVGTGKYSVEDLLAAGADRAALDLSDPAPLLEMLT